MKSVLYTHARNHLDDLIQRVSEERVPVVILGTKGRGDSVLIAKDEFDNLVENLHIVGRPAWVRSIKRGIRQLDARKGKRIPPDEVLRF